MPPITRKLGLEIDLLSISPLPPASTIFDQRSEVPPWLLNVGPGGPMSCSAKSFFRTRPHAEKAVFASENTSFTRFRESSSFI